MNARGAAPRRFTITRAQVDGDRVRFDRDETRHLARVLRLGPGDTVLASDGRGEEYTVRIDEVADTARGTIVDHARGRAESPLRITLIQGIPKGDKMEAIVRASTELGVARVVPVITERTIVRLERERWRERARRWQRVATEATKQCGRATVPEIAAPVPLTEMLVPLGAAGPGELRVCLWEGPAPTLRAVLDTAERVRDVLVVVGPEGGLAEREVSACAARGFARASLGPRILRTETAGLAIAAILQFHAGDVGRPA